MLGVLLMSPDFADELPTRPDNPATVARRCKHCGQVYGDHVLTKPSHKPLRYQAHAKCLGLRRNFDPEEHADDDRSR